MDDKNAPRPLYTHGQKVVRPPSLEQAKLAELQRINRRLRVIGQWVTLLGVLGFIVLVAIAVVALIIVDNWMMSHAG